MRCLSWRIDSWGEVVVEALVGEYGMFKKVVYLIEKLWKRNCILQSHASEQMAIRLTNQDNVEMNSCHYFPERQVFGNAPGSRDGTASGRLSGTKIADPRIQFVNPRSEPSVL